MSIILQLPYDIRAVIREYGDFTIYPNGKIVSHSRISKKQPIYKLLLEKKLIYYRSYYGFLSEVLINQNWIISYNIRDDYDYDDNIDSKEKKHCIILTKIFRSRYAKHYSKHYNKIEHIIE